MNDYLNAYRKRLERNAADLIQLIKDVLIKDPSIEAYTSKLDDGSGLLHHVCFFKNDQINSIWFHEVPYRWSGCGYGEFHNSHSGGENSAMPFTADDVINNFQAIQTTSHIKTATKDAYLKWHSWLIKYKTEPA